MLLQFILLSLYNIIFFFTYLDKENWMWTIILIVISSLLIKLEIKRSQTIISPLCMWYIFWLILLSFARMDLGTYDFGTTWKFGLVISLIFVNYSFLFGFALGNIRTKVRKTTANFEYCASDSFGTAIIAFLFASFISFCINVLRTGYIPQLSGDVNELRGPFVETPLYTIINICRFTFALIPIYLKYSDCNKRKNIVKLLGVACFMTEMLSGWRGYLFQALLLFITSHFLLYNNIKSINKTKIAIGIVAAFFFIGYIAVTRGGDELDMSVFFELTLVGIYMYIAPNFLNLQSAMLSVIPKYYPFYTVEGLWSLFIAPKNMPGYENIDQNIGAFNVSTYLLQAYADGGLLGMVLLTFILGYIAAYSFKIARYNKNVYTIVLLGAMNATVFTMHNGLLLRSSSCFVWLFCGYYLSRKKTKKNEKTPSN